MAINSVLWVDVILVTRGVQMNVHVTPQVTAEILYRLRVAIYTYRISGYGLLAQLNAWYTPMV